MNNKKISICVLSVMALSSFSVMAEPPKFYGKLDIALTHSENGTTTQNKKQGTVLENNFSNIGVKGSEKLSSDVKLLYKVEVEVDSATQEATVFKARNTYLGIKSERLGTILVGRNDTVMKTSKGTAEAFALTNAAYSRMIDGQVRKADGITYYSPKLANLFTLNATYLMDDNYEGNDETQYALSFLMGDKKFKTSDYYFALAYNTIGGIDAYRSVGQVKLGDLVLSGLYQNTESQKNSDKSGGSYFFSAIYSIGDLNLKAEYGKDNAGFGKFLKNSVSSADYKNATDVDIDSVTVGADYNLSKSMRVYAHYAIYSGDYRVSNSSPTIELDDDNIASIGVRYNF
ncbi:porin [Shewanella mesophila]|uniref:porin n=1 Tax=Shewanella mesophila TaxID=2864208 RepID=UPI001C658F8A|nr:porin [Shewanella mesophila]QYJ87080.1 porin [Shewanella mesophila]